MPAAGVDGLKTRTFGPKSGFTAVAASAEDAVHASTTIVRESFRPVLLLRPGADFPMFLMFSLCFFFDCVRGEPSQSGAMAFGLKRSIVTASMYRVNCTNRKRMRTSRGSNALFPPRRINARGVF